MLCYVIVWIFYFFGSKNICLLHSQNLIVLGNICKTDFPLNSLPLLDMVWMILSRTSMM